MSGDLATARPDTPARPSRQAHFPCLEGLRALAASAVVLTHAANIAGDARSGWVARPAAVADIGVAIFFALSGFLIYRPFARAHLDGRPGMRARSFWWRRALRIFPAYWLALSFFWATGFFALGGDWWRYYLFLQIYNVFSTLHGVVQAWSLATEVTFYLAIPLWSGLVRRVVGRGRSTVRIELGGIAGLFALGYVSRFLFDRWHHYALPPHFLGGDGQGVLIRQLAFSWLPNQIDLFALGMAVAVLWSWAERAGRLDELGARLGRAAGVWWAAALGVYLVITYVLGPAPIATGNAGLHWQARQALYGLVGVLLLVPLVFGDQSVGSLRRVLSWRPVVWVGTVSYGFYLFHLDLMARFAKNLPRLTGHLGHGQRLLGSGEGDTNLLVALAVGFGAGLLAAAISWYVLEKPLGRFKDAV